MDDGNQPSTAHTSASKRKRLPGDDTPPRRGAESDVSFSEYDDETPNKRLRTNPHESDVSASEDNESYRSKQPRSIRRKKGSRNLSNLNLRHAAQAQTPSQATIRGSRFQEGSLTDKPSDRPPSFFTRFSRTGFDDVELVDTLMSEYHSDAVTPPSLARSRIAEHTDGVDVESSVTKKEEAKGFFQFGRQLVANFHPVALWKSVWNETKEELTREKMEEDARKARLKATAEAKYAEMKKTGHFSLPIPSSMTIRYQTLAEDVLTPRDSAIAFDSADSSADHSRNTSAATVLRSFPESAEHSANEVPESNTKLSHGFRDRLHLKRPSLSNLKRDLRRMRSDLSLAGPREPSSSISPIKTDFEGSTLRKAASRADLRKKHKLEKKVDHLQNKLDVARAELEEALADASPMPALSGKYERFSVMSKRPNFIPGKLQSVPSERILLAQDQLDVNGVREDRRPSEVHARKTSDLSLKDFLAGQQQHPPSEDEDTVKPSRARAYPPLAASLFNFDFPNSNTENITPPEQKQDQVTDTQSESYYTSEAEGTMDPNTISTTGVAAPQPPKAGDPAALDAKLKALDANYKTARKASQPTKKRKTAEKDTAFKSPGADSDSDAEWADMTPKKKHKPTGKSDNSPRPKISPKKTKIPAGVKIVAAAPAGSTVVSVEEEKDEEEEPLRKRTKMSTAKTIEVANEPALPNVVEEEEPSTKDTKSSAAVKVTGAAVAEPALPVVVEEVEEEVAAGTEKGAPTVSVMEKSKKANPPIGRYGFQWPDDVF